MPQIRDRVEQHLRERGPSRNRVMAAAVCQQVSRPETIRRFRTLPDRFAVGDELNRTHKVRRGRVRDKFALRG